MSKAEHAEPVEACGGPPTAPFVLRQAQDAQGAGFVLIKTELLHDREVNALLDILYIAITIVFFAVCASFARGCEKLSREE